MGVLSNVCGCLNTEYPIGNALLGRAAVPFSMSPGAMNHHYSAYIFTWTPLKPFH